jgi:hypothetical protein
MSIEAAKFGKFQLWVNKCKQEKANSGKETFARRFSGALNHIMRALSKDYAAQREQLAAGTHKITELNTRGYVLEKVSQTVVDSGEGSDKVKSFELQDQQLLSSPGLPQVDGESQSKKKDASESSNQKKSPKHTIPRNEKMRDYRRLLSKSDEHNSSGAPKQKSSSLPAKRVGTGEGFEQILKESVSEKKNWGLPLEAKKAFENGLVSKRKNTPTQQDEQLLSSAGSKSDSEVPLARKKPTGSLLSLLSSTDTVDQSETNKEEAKKEEPKETQVKIAQSIESASNQVLYYMATRDQSGSHGSGSLLDDMETDEKASLLGNLFETDESTAIDREIQASQALFKVDKELRETVAKVNNEEHRSAKKSEGLKQVSAPERVQQQQSGMVMQTLRKTGDLANKGFSALNTVADPVFEYGVQRPLEFVLIDTPSAIASGTKTVFWDTPKAVVGYVGQDASNFVTNVRAWWSQSAN